MTIPPFEPIYTAPAELRLGAVQSMPDVAKALADVQQYINQLTQLTPMLLESGPGAGSPALLARKPDDSWTQLRLAAGPGVAIDYDYELNRILLSAEGGSDVFETVTATVSMTSPVFIGSLQGNADTVTNGVYTTGSYSDPDWITSLDGSKITGAVVASVPFSGITFSGLVAGQVLRAIGPTAALFGALALANPNAVTGVLPNENTTASALNTPYAIVARDSTGAFASGTHTITGNLDASGNVVAGGTLTVSGNTTLGDATTDTTTNAGLFWAQYRSNFYPSTKSDPRTGANSWGGAIPAIANALAAFGTTSSERALLFLHAEAGSEGPLLFLGKTRGTNPGVLSAVSSGDNLGTLSMRGAGSSTAAIEGFRLNARVNGAVSATSLPTDVYIATHNGTTLADRWLWQAAGHFVPNATASYDIGSSTFRVNTVWSGGLNLSANLVVAGNTTLGNATSDALTISSSAVTWSGNPTHSGNHTISQTTATPLALARPASNGTVNISYANNTATLYAGMDANEAWAVGGNQDLTSSPWMTLTSALLTLPTAITAPTGTFTNFSGTMTAGAVPASLVTAGTFGAGAYTFPSTLDVTGLATFAASTNIEGVIGFRVAGGTTYNGQMGAFSNNRTTYLSSNLAYAGSGSAAVNTSWLYTSANGDGVVMQLDGDAADRAVGVHIYTASASTGVGATVGTLTRRISIDTAGVSIPTGTLAVAANATIGGTLGVTGATALSSTLTQTATTASLAQSATFAVLNVGSGTGTGSTTLNVSGAAGQDRSINLSTGVNRRWVLRANNAAESGSDAGSAFQLIAINDAGTPIDVPLAVNRVAGGAMTISRPVSMASTLAVGGNVTVTGTSLTIQNAGYTYLRIDQTDSGYVEHGVISGSANGFASVVGNAGFAGLGTYRIILEGTARHEFTQTAASLAQSATSSIVNIGSGTGSGGTALVLRAVAGQNRYIEWASGTSSRWRLFATNTAESGSNAGSPFVLNAYDDSGVSIDTPLIIVRGAGGAATWSRHNVFPAATTSIPSIRLPHGTAPSSPTNGDVWTTTAGLYARINGVTVGPFSAGGSGDVVGPASATDNAVVRYDGTTGKLVQNSAVTIADTGRLTSHINTVAASSIPVVAANLDVTAATLHNVALGVSLAGGLGARVLDVVSVTKSSEWTSSASTNSANVVLNTWYQGAARSFMLAYWYGSVEFPYGLTVGDSLFVNGPIRGYASTTTNASLRVPHGTAPSSPTNGDYWTDTGSAKVRINGVTHYASWERQAAVADATGSGDVVTQFNDLLAKLRTINVITT